MCVRVHVRKFFLGLMVMLLGACARASSIVPGESSIHLVCHLSLYVWCALCAAALCARARCLFVHVWCALCVAALCAGAQ